MFSTAIHNKLQLHFDNFFSDKQLSIIEPLLNIRREKIQALQMTDEFLNYTIPLKDMGFTAEEIYYVFTNGCVKETGKKEARLRDLKSLLEMAIKLGTDREVLRKYFVLTPDDVVPEKPKLPKPSAITKEKLLSSFSRQITFDALFSQQQYELEYKCFRRSFGNRIKVSQKKISNTAVTLTLYFNEDLQPSVVQLIEKRNLWQFLSKEDKALLRPGISYLKEQGLWEFVPEEDKVILDPDHEEELLKEIFGRDSSFISEMNHRFSSVLPSASVGDKRQAEDPNDKGRAKKRVKENNFYPTSPITLFSLPSSDSNEALPMETINTLKK